MVANLEVSHDILLQKINFKFGNNYSKARLKGLRAENEQIKGKIYELEDENCSQKKINTQLKTLIAKIITLLKWSKFEELFKIKFSLSQTDKSKTVVETDGLLKDIYRSVETIGTNFSEPGIIRSSKALSNTSKTSSKRLLLTSTFSFNNVSFLLYTS